MFTLEELEAIVLGARLAGQRGDVELEKSASRVVAKIKAAVPSQLQERMERVALYAPPTYDVGHGIVNMSQMRDCIRKELKIKMDYEALSGVASERVIWPVAIAFFSGSTLLSAWCELRNEFRHFRTDRIRRYTILDEKYNGGSGRLLRAWETHVTSETDKARTSCPDQKKWPTTPA
jgi:predicted DNA-binding transcriptional regulator YafY